MENQIQHHTFNPCKVVLDSERPKEASKIMQKQILLIFHSILILLVIGHKNASP